MGLIEIATKPRLTDLHPYVLARLIEVEARLDNLTDRQLLDPRNFHHQTVVDLGTGTGAGLIALRRRSLGRVIGVDYNTIVPDYSIYSEQVNQTNGSRLSIPSEGVVDISTATIHRDDIQEFVAKCKPESVSLFTLFHTSINRLHPSFLANIGTALTPGGQFLITSDLNRTWLAKSKHPWGRLHKELATDILEGGIDWHQPTPVTSPLSLIQHLGGWDHLAELEVTHRLHGTTSPDHFRLFRDRHFWLFTKTTSR